MSWSYRICKSEIDGNIRYDIREVYERHGVTQEAIAAVCFIDELNPEEDTEEKCIQTVRKQLTMMLMDTYKPIYEIK